LTRNLAELHVEPYPGQMAQLISYLELLDKWNRSLNLTGLAPEGRVRRLVAEPFWLARHLHPGGRFLDIGSGNGSPAIPWCVACSFSSADLVEARSRRAAFLRVAGRRLNLELRVRNERIETLSRPLTPDWVTLQGVRLGPQLLREVRALNPQARVVWLTRDPDLPEPPSLRIVIPGTDREAYVFG